MKIKVFNQQPTQLQPTQVVTTPPVMHHESFIFTEESESSFKRDLDSVNRQIFKDYVNSYYSFQKLRIQTGNRLVAHFYRKLGISPKLKLGEQVVDEIIEHAEEAEEVSTKEEAKLIIRLKEDFKRITDVLITEKQLPSSKKFEKLNSDARGHFDTFAEYTLMEQYMSLVKSEERMVKEMKNTLESFPIWTEFLSKIHGCGPLMGSVIVTSLDPHEAHYPSSFWKFCGVDVAPDGRGRKNFKEHLVEREYTDRAGETQTKLSITYNPFVKTKLLGVFAPCLIKAKKSKYVLSYYDYRNRLDNHPAHMDKVPAHKMRMALRYMIKRFLVDLHTTWRALEGLEVTEEYSLRKLGMQHYEYRKP